MESRVSSQVTTVSQSEQLLAAGIPADRASLFWVRKVVEVDVNGDELWGAWELSLTQPSEGLSARTTETRPAFTVVDLLEMIECNANSHEVMYVIHEMGSFSAEITGSNPVYFACTHLIDAVFQLILQLQMTGRLVHRIPSAGMLFDSVACSDWRSVEVHPDLNTGRVLLHGEFRGSETVTGGYWDSEHKCWHTDIGDDFVVTGWRPLNSH